METLKDQVKNRPLVVKTESAHYGQIQEDAHYAFWLQDSLSRVYPKSAPNGGQELELVTARNARLSFQACVHNHSMENKVSVECEVEGTKGLQVLVRRVGWVQQQLVSPHTLPGDIEGLEFTPGLVPDPLYPEAKAIVGPFANQSFWISIQVSADIKPAIYPMKVTFKSSDLNGDVVLTALVDVRSTVIKPRENFPITDWWNLDCIYDWHQVEPFGEEFFRIIRPYLENMRDHGTNVIYVSILNCRRELCERPPQLLKVQELEPGKYKFDWELVRRFVRLAKEVGFDYYEWTHFFAYSHNKDRVASAGTPTPIYTERNGTLELLFPWDLDATGPVFENYLNQFLLEFKHFLEEEGILKMSLFHICDEPGDGPEDVANYKRARKLLSQIDPSIKVMDAVFSDIYAVEGMTDYPVPIAAGATSYVEKGIPHWVYYCCGPGGPYINRFFDTPLAKIRIQGWMFYKLRTLGFLHWGLNYWYVMNSGFDPEAQVLIDPFTDGSSGLRVPYGDPFVVYPGKDGPLDSIRWEVFAESMQDYALLQTLGVDPDGEMLQSIIHYGDFPKSEDWVKEATKKLLS